MFEFFGKKGKSIYSPVRGKCIDITEVSDIGFSSKVMGDGLAIVPTEGEIKAPCDGKVIMIFPTGHALGLLADNGMEILLHIGIDTVNLEGKGFTVLTEVNRSVKRGETLVKFDLEQISKEYAPSVMMIIANQKPFEKCAIGEAVNETTVLMRVKD